MAKRDTLYYELHDALVARGCAICRLGRRAGESYLDALIHEGITDPGLRDTLRDARGLCRSHGWRMADKRGSVLGVAIVYEDVINTLVRILEDDGRSDARSLFRRTDRLSDRLSAKAECPACRLATEAEKRAAKTLLKHIDLPEIQSALTDGGGLCLDHLRLALGMARRDQSAVLAELQATAWRSLRSELGELIRKHDYRFAEETIGAEADSWLRAVAAIGGLPEGQDRAGLRRQDG